MSNNKSSRSHALTHGNSFALDPSSIESGSVQLVGNDRRISKIRKSLQRVDSVWKSIADSERELVLGGGVVARVVELFLRTTYHDRH